MVDLKRKRYWVGVAVIVCLILLGFAFIFLLNPASDPKPQQTLQPENQSLVPENVPETDEPPTEEPAEVPLPPQEKEDKPEVRQLIVGKADEVLQKMSGEISRHPQLRKWLGEKEITQRFVTAVDNVARGKSPGEILPFLRPPSEFMEKGDNSDIILFRPASGSRYDLFLDVFESLDPETLAKVYADMEPVLQQVYQDQGYPDGDFSETMQRAVVELLKAPRVTGPVYLKKKVLTYAYFDKGLEELSDARKHVIRMGPVNAARFQLKLRTIALAMGMDEGGLPEPVTFRPDVPPADHFAKSESAQNEQSDAGAD
ncbi:MAG: DUF3014 domain-containing protein [Desulfovibrionales bacterium]